MITQWAPGPLHSKGRIRVFLFEEVLLGHYKAQAIESLLNSGATNKAVFILEM